jgi:hypothetical protein
MPSSLKSTAKEFKTKIRSKIVDNAVAKPTPNSIKLNQIRAERARLNFDNSQADSGDISIKIVAIHPGFCVGL